MNTFTAIPTNELRINEPEFKAGKWERTRHNGEAWEISACYELVDGRWEGFVAMQKAK